MVDQIDGRKVIGIIKDTGQCPDLKCNKLMKVKGKGYTLLKNKNAFVSEIDGENYLQCRRCGQLIMVPRKAA